MKRTLALFLSLVLALTLIAPSLTASAADMQPTPPDWCPAEEYVVFPGSQAYEADTWEKILSLRAHAAAGNLEPVSGVDTVLFNRLRELQRMTTDPGVRFELGLLSVKFALNAAAKGEKVSPSTDFEMAATYAGVQEPATYLCYLWNARLALASRDITTGLEGGLSWYVGALEYLLSYEQFTMEDVYNNVLTSIIPAERLSYAKSLIFVTLDGTVVHPRSVRLSADYLDTTTAQARYQRTMVPVRRLAELMGATVDYDAQTGDITIRRAEDVFVMTLGSTQATRNGVPFQMDVAPYAENNRTYIPIRYIAEFFGQKVEWLADQQHVRITEDKSVAEGSNLEHWALAMSAVLNYENNPGEAMLFGGKQRFGTDPVGGSSTNRLGMTGPDMGRKILREGWGIIDRAALLETATVLSNSSHAWDLFRVSTLAQWGYLAGFVTYREALAMVEPAAIGVYERYDSWKEAYTDYLTGWVEWSGQGAADVWQTSRGQLYQTILEDPAMAHILDDTLFRDGVIGLPDGN